MKYFINNKKDRAFIVSPEYGIGWYTQHAQKYPECATDPELVGLVLEYQTLIAESKDRRSKPEVREAAQKNVEFLKTRIEQYASYLWKDGFWKADGLRVEWAPEHSIVRYSDLDGAETVVIQPMYASGSLIIA